jgi:hypothetical protein
VFRARALGKNAEAVRAPLSVRRALQLPLRLHGIELGRPVDVLIDATAWRVLGFEVVSGDGSHRFVPFTTVRPKDDELAIGSALLLLEQLDFYRARARSFRELIGTEGQGGKLQDLLVADDGEITMLVLEDGGGDERRVRPLDAPNRAA